MKLQSVVRGLALSSALLGATALRAQTPPAPPAPPPAAAPATPPKSPASDVKKPDAAPKVEVRAPNVIRVSPADRQRETDLHIGLMRGWLSKAIDLSALSRRDKDVVRLNCIQEKITALKALLRVAEQASISGQEASSRSDREAADYELQRVRLARTKSQQTSAEANSCVGEVAVYTGPVHMEVETDPDLPQRDPTQPLLPPTRLDTFPGILDRPQALSPPM